MSCSLVIVESPAKCKKIESYLGPGYKVIASFGHLRTISGLESIDVKNGFETKYSIIQENLKLKQIEKIRSEIAKADDIIIATDDDREGEAIGWHICDLFGLNVDNTKRIIFHEITETAIQSAIFHPKRININLVKAQQTRQILDMLVGFTISPILWNSVSKTHSSGLSAGRCQTPALRLVYDNYLEIKSSPGKIIYNTTGYFTNLNLLFELNKQFTNIDECRYFLEKCKCWDFICSTTSPKKVIKKAPEPLTTSSLLQLASNELNISPKDTMKYAQQLYEGGYITYMRTDSKKYSNEFIENAKIYIRMYHGEQYINQTVDNLTVGVEKDELMKKTRKTVAERKGIPPPQEAHESIRPVNINIRIPSVEDTLLQAKSLRLYELIWKRTLKSCMSSAQYNSVSAKIIAPLDCEFVYKAEQSIFLGWQIVDNVKTEGDKVNNSYQYINSLKQNISIPLKKIDSKITMHELNSHYTEARLVQLLEENGIGRPSTFASLVDKIQERKYVEKQNIMGKQIECVDLSLSNNSINELTVTKEFGNEKNKLVIQPLGVIVIEFLLSKFDYFFNYDYTKQMEDKLDLIANTKYDWISVCSACYKELIDTIDSLRDLQKFSIVIDDEHTLIIGKYGPLVKRVDKKNPKNVSFLPVKQNLDIEHLKYVHNIDLTHVLDTNININILSTNAIGKYKGLDLFIKKGKYGIYAQWGKETKSLKVDFSSTCIDNINYIDVLKFLDRDTVLDPTRPVGFVRELNNQFSIRTGKYGDYIFYKKLREKKPKFFKLNGFDSDYKKCDKLLLLNWIKQTYDIG
jgi:DNA topoisomerase-1